MTPCNVLPTKRLSSLILGGLLAMTLEGTSAGAPTGAGAPADLSRLGRRELRTHRFSTLFTAQDVRDRLGTEEGLVRALDWCRQTAVTKVYIEVFRDGYQADRATLQRAKERFLAQGFSVSGCVTTTLVGKRSTASRNSISCYTDEPTQERLQQIFEYAASLFDEIMIDDFWFTDCACSACEAARASKLVTVGPRTYPVAGDRWEDYRCELMLRLSQDRLLGPAKRVNPKARLIIKYPQWYDNFHERGYEVLSESAAFDRTWVGTEVRDYADRRWGGTVPYEGYFIMRWLGGIGGEKCSGGWYDWLGTTERTYVEQARQTILAGARESFLFCYGGLQSSTGPKNVAALRTNLPELFTVARQVKQRRALGIAAYKPANSHPGTESRVFDFVGMLGLPLAPTHLFPTNASAAFFSIHALKDEALTTKLGAYIASGRPVLITDGLAQRLAGQVDLNAKNVHVLRVGGDPKKLLTLQQQELDSLRAPFLRPFGVTLEAPNRVGLYLFSKRSWVVENFTDDPVQVRLNGKPLSVGARGWTYRWE